MTTNQDVGHMVGWASSLEDIDREAGRLAMLCQVRVLEPAAIARLRRTAHPTASRLGRQAPHRQPTPTPSWPFIPRPSSRTGFRMC